MIRVLVLLVRTVVEAITERPVVNTPKSAASVWARTGGPGATSRTASVSAARTPGRAWRYYILRKGQGGDEER